MRLATILALLLLPLAATAQVYKWKDANGKTHYSDQPPAEAKTASKTLAPVGDAGAGAPVASRAAADKRLEAAKQAGEAKDKAAKAEQERAEEAQRQQACERSRMNLQGLQSGQIRFRMSPSGEREALDGAVRDAELAEAQRAVDINCAPKSAPATK
jgi:hypothetical protein